MSIEIQAAAGLAMGGSARAAGRPKRQSRKGRAKSELPTENKRSAVYATEGSEPEAKPE